MFDPAWIMVGIAVAGIILQAGIGAAFIHVLRSEVKALRERVHDHGNLLTEHEARINEHGRRLDDHDRRLRDVERGE